MSNMKAAVFKDIENMEVTEIPVPKCPLGGVLIKVMACGICGGDVRNYHSGLKDGMKNRIMGHEISGIIIESNDNIFKKDDRVALAPDVSCGKCFYCKRGLVNLCVAHKMLGTHYEGGYAQYIALEKEVIQNGFIEKIPNDMDFFHAAFAETASAVIACQKLNEISLGDTVVIIGDGPVGCLHIEVARARGASKIILIGKDKLDLAKEFNPDYIFDNSNPEQIIGKVKEITNAIGADIVICAVPTVVVQNQALQMARKRGRVIIYGGVPKNKEMSSLNSNLIHYNEITIIGAFSYPKTALKEAIDAIDTKKIHADKYITSKVSLDNITEGMRQIETGAALKVMIDPWVS